MAAGTLIVTGPLTSAFSIDAGATLQGSSATLLALGTVADNGTLVFDQATTGTFANAMHGTGAILKQNAGALTLGGTSAVASTEVAAGSLIVTGALTSAFTIDAGATLQGATGNLLALGTVTDNGTLAFDQASDGTFANAIDGTGALIKQGAGALNAQRRLQRPDDRSRRRLADRHRRADQRVHHRRGRNAAGRVGQPARARDGHRQRRRSLFDQAAAGTFANAIDGTGADRETERRRVDAERNLGGRLDRRRGRNVDRQRRAHQRLHGSIRAARCKARSPTCWRGGRSPTTGAWSSIRRPTPPSPAPSMGAARW